MNTPISRAGLLVLLLVATACSPQTAAGPDSSQAPVASAEQAEPSEQPTATPRPTPRPTPRATPRPTPTAAPEAEVAWTQVVIKPWINVIDSLQYELIIEVTNTGSGWANLSGAQASYTIYHVNGNVLDTGNFLYAFPGRIGPGEKGYFVDSGYIDNAAVADIGEVEPAIRYDADDNRPNVAYEVSNLQITQESYGNGLEVSGVVTNTSDELAESPMVGVIFFDAGGVPIGALYDNGLDPLEPGQRIGFQTSYPGTPPMTPADVASYEVFAFEFSFF